MKPFEWSPGEEAWLRVKLARCACEVAASGVRLRLKCGHGGAPALANARAELHRAERELANALAAMEALP